MKNLFLPVLLGIAVLFTTFGCSTKINTAAPYKSITVVYGLLDIGDTAHYIRIQKAFLDQNQSAYDMAKVSDSSFYLNLDVSLKEIDPTTHTVHNTYSFTKVNMNDEGYPKDSGLFFTDPSYAYKLKQTLSPNYRYRLVIHNPQTGETDSAETTLLSESPQAGGFVVTFFDVANNTILLNEAPTALYTLPVVPPDSALMIQGLIRFHWVDKNITTGVETDRSYDWNFDSETLPYPQNSDNSVILQANAVDFLNVLKTAMGPAPVNTKRYLDSTDIYIYAGTPAFYNYQLSVQQAGVGITGSSIQPIFSNIVGNNVYGLFTSRAQRYKLNIAFAGPTFTYIVNNSVLEGTGIQPIPSDH